MTHKSTALSDSLTTPIVVLDMDTTGLLSNRADRVTEIGAVRMVDGRIDDTLSLFLDPERVIPPEITALTGMSPKMALGAPKFGQIAPKLLAFIGDAPIAAHHARFALSFFGAELGRAGLKWAGLLIDTQACSKRLLPTLDRHGLSAVCRTLDIKPEAGHRAVDGAMQTAKMLQRLLAIARENGVTSLAELASLAGKGVPASGPIVSCVLCGALKEP